MKNVSILWHKHDAGTTWFYPALQVQDRPEQKNKRNSTIQSRTIRVLMIKTVWLPIVRLNRYMMDITKKKTIICGAQIKLSVSTIKISGNVKHSFISYQTGTFHFTSCLSQSVLSHTDTSSHIFFLTKCPNQLYKTSIV